MSHVVTVKTEIRDGEALRAACRRLHLSEPVHRVVRLFSATATGHAVELPGWNYPVVCDLASGQIHFDNYQEAWGRQAGAISFLDPIGECHDPERFSPQPVSRDWRIGSHDPRAWFFAIRSRCARRRQRPRRHASPGSRLGPSGTGTPRPGHPGLNKGQLTCLISPASMLGTGVSLAGKRLATFGSDGCGKSCIAASAAGAGGCDFRGRRRGAPLIADSDSRRRYVLPLN